MQNPSLVHPMHNLGFLTVVEITPPNEFCQVMTDLFTHLRHFPSQFFWGEEEMLLTLYSPPPRKITPKTLVYSLQSCPCIKICFKQAKTLLKPTLFHFFYLFLKEHLGNLSLSWKAARSAVKAVTSSDRPVLKTSALSLNTFRHLVTSVLSRKLAQVMLWLSTRKKKKCNMNSSCGSPVLPRSILLPASLSLAIIPVDV